MAQMGQPHGRIVIITTLFVAMILTIIPLPDWAVLFRPEWIAMVLIYWAIALPHRASVGTGFLVGLCADILKGTMLGQHALSMTIISFLAVKVHQQIRVYPMWQQALSVMALIVLNQMLVLWTNGVAGIKHQSWIYWLPALSSALLWPWVYLILRDLRRHFGVK